jgi:UrcA family protein
MTGSRKFAPRAVLLAGVFGLALAAVPATAQDRYDDGAYGAPEDVIIVAPRFRADSHRLNGPLEKVSLSTHVRYDDLDLRSWRDARELKLRVRDAAQDTCTRIAQAYPVQQAFGTSCYRDALQNGELRANAAIRDARDRRYED